MRIRVTDVLDLLAAGLSREQVIEELPDLEPEDVDACLRFASHAVRDLGIQDAEDAEIFAAARAAGIVVMTKAPH
jgi:predicted nuclease of predicted toxin-antitoxin system